MERAVFQELGVASGLRVAAGSGGVCLCMGRRCSNGVWVSQGGRGG